jgi:large subunit ribosomal protein L21
MVGTPVVGDAFVLATATEQGRGEKLIVFKYKSKKRYRHKRGHRQELTFLTIDDIVANGKSLITGEAPVFKEKPAPGAETEDAEGEVAEEETSAEATEEAPQVEQEKRSRRRRATKADESEAETEE